MTPTYANARRLTEYLIGLESMRLVIYYGVHDHSEGDTPEIKALLDKAINEAIPVGTEKDRYKQRRRGAMLVRNVMVKPFMEAEEKVSKFGLAVYYMLRNLMEQGLFVIEEGSSAERAMEAVLNGLAEYTTLEYARMDKSAFKAGRKMLERLQAEGYYREAGWVLAYENAGS